MFINKIRTSVTNEHGLIIREGGRKRNAIVLERDLCDIALRISF